MFAEEGYPGTDVQVLADELGIGKATIYRYFVSKEDLFLGAVDRAMRHLHAHITASTEHITDPIEKIKQAIRSFLTFFHQNPDLRELIIQERSEFRDRHEPTYIKHRNQNIGPWKELLKELIRTKRIRDIPVDSITNFISNTLYGKLFTGYYTQTGATPEHDTEVAIDIIFRGLLTKEDQIDQIGIPTAIPEVELHDSPSA